MCLDAGISALTIISSAWAGIRYLAARAAARIGDAFGVGVALSAFLESPTVAGLAAKIAPFSRTGQSASESDKDEREDFEV